MDYCATSDDLAADTRRLVEAGFDVEGPDRGGRRLPDGTEIRWKSARIQQEGRVLPFLIEDETPRDLRVPGGPSTKHPNGATGILRLLIAAWDRAQARTSLAALVGSRKTPGDAFPVGCHEFAIVASDDSDEPVKQRLKTLGPGPLAIELDAAARSDAELDPGLARGARIRFRQA